ncbi:MAG TPA: cation transporter [Candidatus Eisenbacteria bacterium]|uniref:Cation transporter n=1 Tax=Eiseniibacteriota bacterium TaxID=2212470 RepID=A0A7V2F3N1_UNCEI|nr:cation transporter [Candidatus Eisenbacteria bacterium]
MGNAHHHTRTDLESGRRITWAGMAVNAALIALKILGGIFGRSKALLADAAHSASDFVSDLLVLIGLHYSMKDGDADHPYGHGKIETLATIGVGALLCLASVKIGLDAALAIHRGDIVSPERFTIIIAALSIVSKEALYQATVRIGRRLKSESLIANAWHHRSDAWSSGVTLVGVTVAVYVPSMKVLDSYAALLVSFFILKIGIDILLGAIKKIIDTSPSAEFMASVGDEIRKEPGVLDCHDLTGRYYASMVRMEAHIEVDPEMTVHESHEIIDRVVSRVRARFDEVATLLIHIDPYVQGGDKKEEGH